MIKTEEVYAKAYTELYEIIKCLDEKDRNKIPQEFLENLKANMNKEYKFQLDLAKDMLEQNFMIETKALYIELYEKFLASEDEEEFWKKYDKICLDMIEDEKKKQYNPDNLFENRKKDVTNTELENVEPNELAVVKYKESIFTKIKNWLKSFKKNKE